MSKIIKKCWQCPWEDTNDNGFFCSNPDLPKNMGMDDKMIKYMVGCLSPIWPEIPEWCPL